MSRKTLIMCVAVLAAMFIALGIAVAFLYSGTGSGERKREMDLDGAYTCLAAVPSDAVLVACSSRLDKACSGLLSSYQLPDSLFAYIDRGDLASMKRNSVAVSLHYSGKLIPLYVFDIDGASDAAVGFLSEKAGEFGYSSQINGDFLLVSQSDVLVKSASRHIDTEVSIADAPGFAAAAGAVSGDVLLFIPHLHSKKLLPVAGGKQLTRHSAFLERFADWSAFVAGGYEGVPYSLSGSLISDGESDEFITALKDCTPKASSVSDVLPSYTVSAVTIPVSNIEKYISGYKSFADSRQSLHELNARQKNLEKTVGIGPEAFFERIGVKEIATASFRVSGKMEKVNLIHTSGKEIELIFKGNDISSLRGYAPAVHSWAYGSFAASVFGGIFALTDESCFTYVNGWIISGSRAAVEEYVVRKALEYNLTSYMADAGKADLLSATPALALAYFSLTEDKDGTDLKPATWKKLAKAMEADYAPAVLTIAKSKEGVTAKAEVHSLTLKKTKAPVFERDTTVVVPAGPYKVKNSHTGKINTFYQNAQKSLCLRDENGKDIWGVPFKEMICGTAHNLDYYANGKLQIIFGAGSKIYIIDRLGRYVSGFPVDLGKEILLGPDVYDFSGAKKYNVLVLHKDNTVEMYNLKGKKPDSWKGIVAPETVKSLPEKITVGGNDYWVVRTSVQTLIYPFYGGEPAVVLEGDSKIRPESEVKVLDATSVQVSCYNGTTRTLKLK